MYTVDNFKGVLLAHKFLDPATMIHFYCLEKAVIKDGIKKRCNAMLNGDSCDRIQLGGGPY